MLTRLSENKTETVVIYESVHRIEKTLVDLAKYFGDDHKIVIGRELTKKFEEYIRGTIAEASSYFKENPGKVK
jgi:16S rRNA (cytidine1402-2'-O)-methyltransferase